MTSTMTPWRLIGQYCAFLIMSQLLGLCLADVTVSVEFVTYRNPSERDWNGKCCDPFCHQFCDHFFIICLDRIDGANLGVPVDANYCSYRRYVTSKFHESNLNTFDHDMHGVQNPVKFDVTKWEGLLFKVVVMDEDSHNGPDLVDIFYKEYYEEVEAADSRASGQGTPRSPSVLQGRRAQYPTSLSVRFNVRCADNYYGKNCDKYCKGMDGNGGHFTCDDQGRNTCKSGWYREDLNCTSPCPPGLRDGLGCDASRVSASVGDVTPMSVTRQTLFTTVGMSDTSQNHLPPQPNTDHMSKSTSVIVGVVVGVIILLLIIIIIIIAIVWSRRRKRRQMKEKAVNTEVNTASVSQQTPTSSGVGTSGGAAGRHYDDNRVNAGMDAKSSSNMQSQTPSHAFVQTSANTNAFSQTPTHAHTQTGTTSNVYSQVGQGRQTGVTSAGVQAGLSPPPYTVSDQHMQPPPLFENPLYTAADGATGSSVREMASLYEEPIKMKY